MSKNMIFLVLASQDFFVLAASMISTLTNSSGGVAAKRPSLSSILLLWLEVFGNKAGFDTHRNPCRHQPIECQFFLFPFCQSTPASQSASSHTRRSSPRSSSARAGRTFSASNGFPVRLSQNCSSNESCSKAPDDSASSTSSSGSRQATIHRPPVSQYSWKLRHSMETSSCCSTSLLVHGNHHRRSLLEGLPPYAFSRAGRQ